MEMKMRAKEGGSKLYVFQEDDNVIFETVTVKGNKNKFIISNDEFNVIKDYLEAGLLVEDNKDKLFDYEAKYGTDLTDDELNGEPFNCSDCEGCEEEEIDIDALLDDASMIQDIYNAYDDFDEGTISARQFGLNVAKILLEGV